MNETNPNQKTVRVEKERCDKNNLRYPLLTDT